MTASARTPETWREVCTKCRRARVACYCERLRPFRAGPVFVILLHPREGRKRIGTGRMAHRCLSNSHLIEGVDFTHDSRVNALLSDKRYFPMLLYPGRGATDITGAGVLTQLIPHERQPLIFVIDGTWATARKMVKASSNLLALPWIRFVPPQPSIYKIRRQPLPECFSTIEAIHFMIDTFDSSGVHRVTPPNAHANLLEVFQGMVALQLTHVTSAAQTKCRVGETSS